MDLSWAWRSGPAPVTAIGPGQGGCGLCGLGDGYRVAKERFDLPDVVLDLLVFVGAGLVVAVAEVGEPGLGAGEQVPDDDQDGTGDGDLGLGLAAAAGDPVVALAEESGGRGGADGGLPEIAAQVTVAPAFLAIAGPGAGLVGARAQPGPRHQVGGVREPGHVQARFGDDGPGQVFADAGDLRQPLHHREHRVSRAGAGAGAGGAVGVDAPGAGLRSGLLLDPGSELGDLAVEEGDLVQEQLGELAVVVAEHAI